MLPCVSLNYYASCEKCDEENCEIKTVFEKVRDRMLEVLTTTSISSMKKKV
jgi:DNA-binding IscR family transcriptional regulator